MADQVSRFGGSEIANVLNHAEPVGYLSVSLYSDIELLDLVQVEAGLFNSAAECNSLSLNVLPYKGLREMEDHRRFPIRFRHYSNVLCSKWQAYL